MPQNAVGIGLMDRLPNADVNSFPFRKHLRKARRRDRIAARNRLHVSFAGVHDSHTRGPSTDFEASLPSTAASSECTDDQSLSGCGSSRQHLTSRQEQLYEEAMTQGNLSNRLNSLTTMGLLGQLEDRVQSATELGVGGSGGGGGGGGKRRRRNLGIERERTFPGIKPKSQHSTALISWAMNCQQNSRGSDLGSIDTPAMSFLLRRYGYPADEELNKVAIGKAREKMSQSLSVSGVDRLTRIATLRQNVKFIEGKFRSLLNKQRSVIQPREELKSASTGIEVEDYHDWPPRFLKQGEAVKFFKRCAKMIIICKRWINMIMDMNKNSSWEKELKTFVDFDGGEPLPPTPATKALGHEPLSFDKNEFKANKEISLSSDVKTILSLRPEARTQNMIKQVMLGLQTLKSLSEYPLDTQEQLCRVAWFQQVPAKKYIIRQGHIPEAFYFILSGLAVVKKIGEGSQTGDEATRVVARLTKGQSFGELGLIFNSPRNATVESGTPMELLVVGKADFLKIFMNNVKKGEDPEHIAFLKQQPVMKFWPFEALEDEPGACLINYFKRGTLVTENGKTSEWIYFIKTGSCEAMKRLKCVTPRSEREIRRAHHFQHAKDNQLFPNIQCRILSSTRTKAPPQPLHPELFRSMTEYYDDIRTSAEEQVRILRLQKSATDESKRSDTSSISQRVSLTIPEIVEPTVSKTNANVYLKRTPPTEDMVQYTLPPIPPRQTDGPGVSASKFSRMKTMLGRTDLLVPTKTYLTTAYREQHESELEPPVSNREEKDDVFVTVEKLQPRDIFGMNTVSFSEDDNNVDEEAPEVALVSRGAEIVMLSKKLFLKHADERVKLSVQELITPYPREQQLQENLQIKADWNVYRQAVLADVMYTNYAYKNFSGVV